MTDPEVFNLVFFAAFSFGLIIISGNLRRYFKDSKRFSAKPSFEKREKAEKKEHVYALIILGIITLCLLIFSGILPLGTVVEVVIHLFAQLAQAANGFLLGAVFVTIAIFSAIYKLSAPYLNTMKSNCK